MLKFTMIATQECARCKAEVLLETAKFCTKCGFKLTAPSSSSSSSPSNSPGKNAGGTVAALFQENTKEATAVYSKRAPRIVRQFGPTKNPTKPKVRKEGRVGSFNKSQIKYETDENSEFLMNPSNASFVSFRDDSKFSKVRMWLSDLQGRKIVSFISFLPLRPSVK